MIHRLRLASGLILLVFVAGHLINHAAGIVSLDAMNAGLKWTIAPWRTVPGLILLAGALAVHLAAALWQLYRRRSLKMPAWEAAQILLGLAIPLLLIDHVTGTRVAADLYGVRTDYDLVLAHYWVFEPGERVGQMVLVLVAWGHAMAGLHYWLRLKRGYAAAVPWLFAVAVALPALAIAGFVAAGAALARAVAADPGLAQVILDRARVDQAGPALATVTDAATAGYLALIGLVVVARIARGVLDARRRRPQVHLPDGRTAPIEPGASVLEALRRAGVPHAAVCGGRGRCSTCRILVRQGADALAPPAAREARVLARIGAPAAVRLACQVAPTADLAIQPLLPPGVHARAGAARLDMRLGEEREVAVLFADLRGFTRLAERRLPFDVVFLLNRWMEEMGRAVEGSGGRIDKFIGDGLMALFGVQRGAPDGCRRALDATAAMGRGLARLNDALAGELPEPLRMGVGVHVGPVVVGEIGYGESRGLTAIGDAVNLASRLEQATKDHGVEAVVSLAVFEQAGRPAPATAATLHEITVRGRQGALAIAAVARAADLADPGGAVSETPGTAVPPTGRAAAPTTPP